MIGRGTPGSSKVPIVLPQSRFNHQFKRNTVDADPIRLEDQDADQVHAGNKAICDVCKKNRSRYICPRGQAPYCSVECYRQLPSASTEAFYENRAQSIMQLEAKEHEEDTLRILNRQYQQQREHGGLPEDDDEDVDMDELKELLSMLLTINEEQDENDTAPTSEHSLEKLMSSMSPTLRAAFERDLQNGSLQKLVLREWHPWWRRELGNGVVENRDNAGEGAVGINDIRPTKTLDERLLGIPSFNQLSKKQNPQLLFHVLDVVYSYCWTLRLYHGISNIISTNSTTKNLRDYPTTEAAETFLSHSRVLHQQSTYQYSRIEEVLVQCTTASTNAKAECNTHWNVLVQDCSLIFTSSRFVGRALIEAMDIIQAAIQDYKKKRKEGRQQHNGKGKDNVRNIDQIEMQIQNLRKVRKKLEYLTAWSKNSAELEGHGAGGTNISKHIEEWRRDWQDSNDDKELTELQIPNNENSNSSSTVSTSAANPLITVVETRQK